MKALPSTTLEAAVRAHLGLTQAELAAYLGVTPGQVAHVEAGRRVLAPAPTQRLFQLAHLLPPLGEEPSAQPALPAAAGPLNAEPLRARLRRCAHRATQLRHELAGLDAQAARAQHWQAALAALPTAPAAPAHLRQWLAARAADATAGLGPAATTRVLLRLRLAGLEAEAAALLKLLTGEDGLI